MCTPLTGPPERLRRRAIARWRAVGLVLVAALCAGLVACGSDDGGGTGTSASTPSEFVLGLAAAKSGTASFFDEAPSRGLQLKVDQINAAGGVDGQRIKLISADTQSDPGRGTAAASQLIEKGADLMAVTCDFDFGSPAATTAIAAGVPAISLCASDPKFADKTTLGPLAFTMGSGTDAIGTIAAEYAYDDKRWKTAYIFQDTSIEYTKSLGTYFEARWRDLGGTVVGRDDYNGLESPEVRAQVTKLRSLPKQPDVIYLPAFTPPGVSVIKQIRDAGITTPILAGDALDYPLLPKVVGKSSDIYAVVYGCLSYCEGTQDDAVTQLDADYKEKYGKAADTSFTLAGYELGAILEEALKRQPDARGDDLVRALEAVPPGTGVMDGVAFSATCHKPTHRAMTIVELSGGRFEEQAVKPVSKIVDVGDNNPCVDG